MKINDAHCVFKRLRKENFPMHFINCVIIIPARNISASHKVILAMFSKLKKFKFLLRVFCHQYLINTHVYLKMLNINGIKSIRT